jgi:hypothetical protein
MTLSEAQENIKIKQKEVIEAECRLDQANANLRFAKSDLYKADLPEDFCIHSKFQSGSYTQYFELYYKGKLISTDSVKHTLVDEVIKYTNFLDKTKNV